jgi:hypothetical protein
VRRVDGYLLGRRGGCWEGEEIVGMREGGLGRKDMVERIVQ